MNDIRKIFKDTVKEAFGFFLNDYGMKCVVTEEELFLRIRYSQRKVFLQIFFDMNSYEISVDIGLFSVLGKESCSYGLSEVLETLLGHNHKIGTFYQASTPEGIVESIKDIAHTVDTYYIPLLKGDKGVFKKIELVSRDASKELMKQMKLQGIRTEAAKAWQEKNYSRIVRLYKAVEPDLTPSEMKKLEYARKHMQGGN